MHGPFDSVKVCELHPQGVVLIRFKDQLLSCLRSDLLLLCECRYSKRQLHASLEDGSVNHAAVRDFDLEAERLDQFAAELEAE
ncbi:unnamed protein product [Brassica napus]|uniref:(rape) hypothetical protein n=1 Tax=Brassica napus TaxID=3708 RepID=A0A816JN37_BRANA|nr:unnamed protein product [Brassica napus]